MQKKKNESRHKPYKINSKWITDLNVKHKTIRLLEDNIGKDLDDSGYGNDLLVITPKAGSTKKKKD